MKASTKRGRSYLCVKLFKGRVTLLFQIFLMRMDKLPKKTGRILPRRDWKSKYYRLLDPESTQVRHLSKVKRKKSIDWYKKLFPQDSNPSPSDRNPIFPMQTQANPSSHSTPSRPSDNPATRETYRCYCSISNYAATIVINTCKSFINFLILYFGQQKIFDKS